MSYFLSQSSKARLETCHPDIQLIIEEAIKYSPIDFGISHGYRSPEEQNELYKKGRTEPGEVVTYLDGFNKKSKHNESPSQAVDVYCWPREIMYDRDHLCAVAGVILSTANRLYDEGKISHRLTSGGDWNRNGVFTFKDKAETFQDLPHYQI